MSTIELQIDGERKIHMKRRFPATALSRLNEKAPGLTEQLTDIVLKPARRAQVEDHVDMVHERGEIGMNTLVTSFELARVKVSELDALHEFCCAITASVEGFKDIDGDPIVWKDKGADVRKDLYDCDVPGAVKVNMYLFAWLLKNGIDPEAAEEDFDAMVAEPDEPDGVDAEGDSDG